MRAAAPAHHTMEADSFGSLVSEAGLDYESRPLLGVFASALPNPAACNYDDLLQQILVKLDSFVESDYVIVLFAGPTRHQPAWGWLLKAYRLLGRKYKKNLKNLYIVHPSAFTKFMLQVLGAVLSPKFSRKLVYIQSLKDLGGLVPLEQFQVPQEVRDFDAKRGVSKAAAVSPAAAPGAVSSFQVFGVDLDKLMGPDGAKGVPQVVQDACIFISEHHMDTEGLLRRSPASTNLKTAKEAYNSGSKHVSLGTWNDPHIAAGLLKCFLRELPTALFPQTQYALIKELAGASDPPALAIRIKTDLLPHLSKPATILLAYVFGFLKRVAAHASANKMTPSNLAIVMGPNLLRSSNPLEDLAMCAGQNGPGILVIRTCIEQVDAIFSIT